MSHFFRVRNSKGIILFLNWFFVSFFIATYFYLPSSGRTQEAASETANFALLKEILISGNTVSVKTDRPTPYNVFTVGSPPRLVLELTNTENDWKKKEVVLKNNALLTRVRAGQFQNEPVKITRIVIELKTAVDYQATAENNKIVLTVTKSGEKSDEQTVNSKSAEPQTAQPTGEQTADSSAPQVTDSMAAAPTPAEVVESDLQKQSQPSQPAAGQSKVPVSANKKLETTEANTPEKSSDQTAAENPKPAAKKIRPVVETQTLKSLEPASLFGRQAVTLDFYDIDIKDLFKILGEKSGVNVVYGDDISGTISIQLRDVPFEDAINTILKLKNLRMIVLGRNITQVLTPSKFDEYKLNAISMTKICPVNYAKAADVNTQLNSILATLGGKGKTLVDDRTNSIIVTDTPEGIEATSRLIADLDKPTPQVMIEAKIVQVSLGKSIDLGITWGAAYTDQTGGQMITIGAAKPAKAADDATATTPGSGGLGLQTRSALNPSGGAELESSGAGFTAAQGLGLSFGFVKDVVRLNAALSALQQKNKSKILSNPKIATVNNQPAVIKSEVSEPYITTETTLVQQAGVTTSQKVNTAKSGINLTVTPTINADGRITMKIVPDITSSQPTSIGIPKTTSQQANTTVVVKDGETFVIGGLITELESDSRAQVPILGSIPILGHLFKKTGISKTRAELLVFVTPKIIPY